jgi:hypothetical protein
MGGAKAQSPGSRYRRARRFRSSQRGVVAVIGTLLALLVFFALFGIFLTQYVPLWMTENESAFTTQTAASFAQLKSYIDSQYVLGGPTVYGVPFTMASQGIPLLAQPTGGTLTFVPTICPGGFVPTTNHTATAGQPKSPSFCVFENITLSSGPGNSGYYSQHVEQGILTMSLPNRYYSPQTFTYEDDGVIQTQASSAELMAVPPPFNVTTFGTNTTLTSSFVSLFGNASTTISQGTQQVFSHLRYSQTLHSAGKYVSGKPTANALNVTFEIGTQNPCAWVKYLYSAMNTSGVKPALHPALGVTSYNWTIPGTSTNSSIVAASSCNSVSGVTTIVALNLNAIDYATVFYAGVQVTVGIGGT